MMRFNANNTITLRELAQDPLFNIFSFDYPFYTDDLEIKKEFERKFYLKYRNYEIGFETVALFKDELEATLYEIMPYYAKLYETELRTKGIDFMLNKDLTETTIRELTGEVNAENTSNANQKINTNSKSDESLTSAINNTGKVNSLSNNKESNVNNGLSSANLNKLTGTSEATDKSDSTNKTDSTNKSNSNTNQTTNSDSTSTNIGTTTSTQTETNTLISKGNIGVTSSAKLLSEWREVLLNIDQEILNELRELFLYIY